MDRRKNANLNEKKWTILIIRKELFIITMANNTPENMTEQQRYHKRNKEIKEILKSTINRKKIKPKSI